MNLALKKRVIRRMFKRFNPIVLRLILAVILLIPILFISPASSKKLTALNYSPVQKVLADNWWEEDQDQPSEDQAPDLEDASSEEEQQPEEDQGTDYSNNDQWWQDEEPDEPPAEEEPSYSCDYDQQSTEYSCSDGQRCWNDQYLDEDTGCSWVSKDPPNHCDPDPSCGGDEGGDQDQGGQQDVQAGYCENGWEFLGGDAGDDNSWIHNYCGDAPFDTNDPNYNPCNPGQQWDINSGSCVDSTPTPEQIDYNDQVYCSEQCGGSCAGDQGAKYCTEDDGSRKYDCTDPENSNLAECTNELVQEFQNVAIEPAETPEAPAVGAEDLTTAGENCGWADLNDAVCNNGQLCQKHIMYCDGEPRGEAGIGGNCHPDPSCQTGAVPSDSVNPAVTVDTSQCDNIASPDRHDDCVRALTGTDQPTIPEAQPSQTPSDASLPSQCRGIASPDRLDDCIARAAMDSPAGFSVTDWCDHISDPGVRSQCLTKTGPASDQDQAQKDISCQNQNPGANYCDGSACIQRSSGWDGNSCTDVFTTVSADKCPNSCGGNTASSGQAVKLLNCLDETDPAKLQQCQQENNRLKQSGQPLDQASLIKNSLTLDDCASQTGDAQTACQDKNNQTKKFADLVDTLSLESCSQLTSQSDLDACNARNQQTIKLAQAKQALGLQDCSTLSDQTALTNCQLGNAQKNQWAQAIANFTPEDCNKYTTDSEKSACAEHNQQAYKDAVNAATPFIGVAQVGASCVYTEACSDGQKKACAGKVENDGGAPVCKYDTTANACGECSSSLDLNAQAKQLMSQVQQAAQQAAQAAAADAPIDSAKYFSQKFQDGAACKQVQICDLSDGSQGEQVCNGKGTAEGTCDLSQGGGVCSPCQTKGTIQLNKVATCNTSTYKCEGMPALSGCQSDAECQPKPQITYTTSTKVSRVPIGANQTVGSNGNIFNIQSVCHDEVVDYDNFIGSLDTNYQNDLDAALFDQKTKKQTIQKCYEQYVDTGQAATVTSQVVTANTNYYYAQKEAVNATNQLDSYYATNVTRNQDAVSDDTFFQQYTDLQQQQEKALADLQSAQQSLVSLGTAPQVDLVAQLDRTSVESRVAAGDKLVTIQDQTKDVTNDLAQLAQARQQVDAISAGTNNDSDLALAQAQSNYEEQRKDTETAIDALAKTRGEDGTGLSQQFSNALEQLPTQQDQQFQVNQTTKEVNNLANVASQSKDQDVIESARDAISNRIDDLADSNISTLDGTSSQKIAEDLQAQANQAVFQGYQNVYQNQIAQGQDTNSTQLQIQNLIDQQSNPQTATAMKNQFAAAPFVVQAKQAADQSLALYSKPNLTEDDQTQANEIADQFRQAKAQVQTLDPASADKLQKQYDSAFYLGQANVEIANQLAASTAANPLSYDNEAAQTKIHQDIIDPLSQINPQAAQQVQQRLNSINDIKTAQQDIKDIVNLSVTNTEEDGFKISAKKDEVEKIIDQTNQHPEGQLLAQNYSQLDTQIATAKADYQFKNDLAGPTAIIQNMVNTGDADPNRLATAQASLQQVAERNGLYTDIGPINPNLTPIQQAAITEIRTTESTVVPYIQDNIRVNKLAEDVKNAPDDSVRHEALVQLNQALQANATLGLALPKNSTLGVTYNPDQAQDQLLTNVAQTLGTDGVNDLIKVRADQYALAQAKGAEEEGGTTSFISNLPGYIASAFSLTNNPVISFGKTLGNAIQDNLNFTTSTDPQEIVNHTRINEAQYNILSPSQQANYVRGSDCDQYTVCYVENASGSDPAKTTDQKIDIFTDSFTSSGSLAQAAKDIGLQGNNNINQRLQEAAQESGLDLNNYANWTDQQKRNFAGVLINDDNNYLRGAEDSFLLGGNIITGERQKIVQSQCNQQFKDLSCDISPNNEGIPVSSATTNGSFGFTECAVANIDGSCQATKYDQLVQAGLKQGLDLNNAPDAASFAGFNIVAAAAAEYNNDCRNRNYSSDSCIAAMKDELARRQNAPADTSENANFSSLDLSKNAVENYSDTAALLNLRAANLQDRTGITPTSLTLAQQQGAADQRALNQLAINAASIVTLDTGVAVISGEHLLPAVVNASAKALNPLTLTGLDAVIETPKLAYSVGKFGVSAVSDGVKGAINWLDDPLSELAANAPDGAGAFVPSVSAGQPVVEAAAQPLVQRAVTPTNYGSFTDQLNVLADTFVNGTGGPAKIPDVSSLAAPIDRSALEARSAVLDSAITTGESQYNDLLNQARDLSLQKGQLQSDINALKGQKWFGRWGGSNELNEQLVLKENTLEKVNQTRTDTLNQIDQLGNDLNNNRTEQLNIQSQLSHQTLADQQRQYQQATQDLKSNQDLLKQTEAQLLTNDRKVLSKDPTKATAADDLVAARQRYSNFQTTLLNDGVNINDFDRAKQEAWAKAYTDLENLKDNPDATTAELDQARLALRQGQGTVVFKSGRDVSLAASIDNLQKAEKNIGSIVSQADTAEINVNKLTQQVEVYKNGVNQTATTANDLASVNNLIITNAAPKNGVTQETFFLNEKGLVRFNNDGSRGIDIIVNYKSGPDGFGIPDSVVVPNNIPGDLKYLEQTAQRMAPGKTLPTLDRQPGQWIPRLRSRLSGDLQKVDPATFQSTVDNLVSSQRAEAIDEATANLQSFPRSFDLNTNTVAPISEEQIKDQLVLAGFRGTNDELDSTVTQLSEQLNAGAASPISNSVPVTNPVRQTISAPLTPAEQVDQAYTDLSQKVKVGVSDPQIQSQLQQIVDISRQTDNSLAAMAEDNGGVYIPFNTDTQAETIKARASRLAPNTTVAKSGLNGFPVIQVTGTSGKETIVTFDDIPHGMVVFPNQPAATEETVRLYRGVGSFDPSVSQIAAIARNDGVSVQDVLDYWDKKITYDQLAAKITNDEDRRFTLAMINAHPPGWTEEQTLARLHIDCSRNAKCGDIYVSVSYDPTEALSFATSTTKDTSLRGVIVMDVPKSQIPDLGALFTGGVGGYGSGREAAIVGEIKPEWVKGYISADKAMTEGELNSALDELNQRLPESITPTVSTQSDVTQEQALLQQTNDALRKRFDLEQQKTDELIAQQNAAKAEGVNCEIAQSVAFLPVTSNVLGASTGPCGPVSSLVQNIPGLNQVDQITQAAENADGAVLGIQDMINNLLGRNQVEISPTPELSQLVTKIDETPKWQEAKLQIDTLSESLRKGEIDLPAFTQKLEQITENTTQPAKTAESSLLIDDKFLSTTAITGGTASPEQLFGNTAWADWLNARTAAKAYEDQPLTVDMMKDLHSRLTLTSNPDIGGKLRTTGIIGGDYTNLGRAVTYTPDQVEAIKNNPYLDLSQQDYIKDASGNFVGHPTNDPNSGLIVYPNVNSQKVLKIADNY